MNRIDRIGDQILKLPIFIIIIATVILNFAIEFVCNYLGNKYGFSLSTDVIPFDSVMQEFWMVVLFAPLLETLFFQYIPLSLCQKIIRPLWIRVLVSALLFGISHFYSWLYIITAFIIGLLFAYVYVTAEKKKYFPFVIVAIAHCCYNFILFTGKHFL